MSKCNLGLECPEHQVKRLISKGINNNIQIFTIDNEGKFYLLKIADLRDVLRYHPKKARIYFRKPSIDGDYSDVGFEELYADNINQVDALPGKSGAGSLENDLDAVTNNLPPFLDEKHANHPPELKIAIRAWTDIHGNAGKINTKGTQAMLKEWMKNNNVKCKSKAFLKRIASIITPQKRKETGGVLPIQIDEEIENG